MEAIQTQRGIGILILIASTIAVSVGAAPVNPHPRSAIARRIVNEWSFSAHSEGWKIQADAAPLDAPPGCFALNSTGSDPVLLSPAVHLEDIPIISIRMRTDAPGPAQIFWSGEGAPGFTESFSSRFETVADGEWHDYHVTCPFPVALRQLRFDPAVAPGKIEIDSIRLEELTPHPLEIESVRVIGRRVAVTVRNHGDEPRTVRFGDETAKIKAGAAREISSRRTPGEEAVETLDLTVTSHALPPLSRRVVALNPRHTESWLWLSTPELSVLVAQDGSAAKVIRFGETIAWLAPIALRGGDPVRWNPPEEPDSRELTFLGPGKDRLTLSLKRDRLHLSIEARESLEGPVVRVPGDLEQGLVAGVEHLGKGETSSSPNDLHGPDRLRYTPDPRLLTMPLMACVTPEAAVALRWEDTALQPVFASPNFFDGSDDHRMALRGRKIEAVLWIGNGFADGGRLEDAVFSAVDQSGGLPPLPEAPRPHDDQLALCLQTLQEGIIREPESGAFYHAVIPGVKNSPSEPKRFGDFLSTLYRLTGELPNTDPLVPGGAHIPNDAIYFLSGNANQWLDRQHQQVSQVLGQQKPDGSFRYDGKFRAGHFEDTASGFCAGPAARLLWIAEATGPAAALEAGLKALEYMKRFRTPRGAQTWECPLHAPDILASAYLVKAYVLGWKLTGDEEYLQLAKRWALSGVPFVYQWADRPIMLYGTTPTLCATNYEAPVWIGRPVQWCGLVFADALLDLEPHDDTLDWRHLAEGILISGEQQQYSEGPSAGLLADSITLGDQQLHPYDINPCALVSLRLRLHGQLAALSIAHKGAHRIVAPFTVTIGGTHATVTAPKGAHYQVLVDGTRIVDIESSKGTDKIKL